jgi:hypothetical protein
MTVTIQIVILWVDTELFTLWSKIQRKTVKINASCFVIQFDLN